LGNDRVKRELDVILFVPDRRNDHIVVHVKNLLMRDGNPTVAPREKTKLDTVSTPVFC
jgi:hypothetical protein